MTTETIGSRIKRLRSERGLNISQLAELIDFSTYTIRKWESDEFNPSMLALIELADFFDMSLDELTGRPECKPMKELRAEVGELRNAVCLKCGKHEMARFGACEGCKYKR